MIFIKHHLPSHRQDGLGLLVHVGGVTWGGGGMGVTWESRGAVGGSQTSMGRDRGVAGLYRVSNVRIYNFGIRKEGRVK